MRAKTVSRFKKKCCLTGTVKLQTYSIHIVFASLIFYKTSFLKKLLKFGLNKSATARALWLILYSHLSNPHYTRENRISVLVRL